MLWLGHIALGYLASKLVISLLGIPLSPNQADSLILIGMMAAILPDIDLVPFFLRHKSFKIQKDKSHRKVWSHAPLLWAFLIIIVASFLKSQFALMSVLVFLIGSLSHFLADSIEYGVFWLWPFSKKKVYIREANGNGNGVSYSPEGHTAYQHYKHFLKSVYIRNWTVRVEAIILIVAAFVFFSS
jgi:membrane-bound metal-dependent hydrolase YbcI (DUF457 family)